MIIALGGVDDPDSTVAIFSITHPGPISTSELMRAPPQAMAPWPIWVNDPMAVSWSNIAPVFTITPSSIEQLGPATVWAARRDPGPMLAEGEMHADL